MRIKVKVADKIERRDFTDTVQVARVLRLGQIGIIVQSKTGHGLCYAVEFDDGEITWFDPDELQLVR